MLVEQPAIRDRLDLRVHLTLISMPGVIGYSCRAAYPPLYVIFAWLREATGIWWCRCQ
jgi:hypothetical protein